MSREEIKNGLILLAVLAVFAVAGLVDRFASSAARDGAVVLIVFVMLPGAYAAARKYTR